jgi:hypothetical protein
MSTLAPRRSSGFGNAILGIFAIAILGCAIAVPVFYKQISEGLG